MLGNRTANPELYTQQNYLSVMSEKNISRGKIWHRNKNVSKLNRKTDRRKKGKGKKNQDKFNAYIQCVKRSASCFSEQSV